MCQVDIYIKEFCHFTVQNNLYFDRKDKVRYATSDVFAAKPEQKMAF